jgi:hypothetical protein
LIDYEDAVAAALDLVRRTGARGLELGYLDDVLPGRVDWYAHAQYAGARVTVEHHRGPLEALEALAHQLLSGARCLSCGGPVALPTAGDPVDGAAEEPRPAPRCHYRREGPQWVRGCEPGRQPAHQRRRKRGRPTRGARRR